MKNDKIVSNMTFKKVTSILKRYGVKEISIFGSYARVFLIDHKLLEGSFR